MDIYTIFTTIFKYSLIAIGGIAVIIPFYAVGFLIYKKVFHGKHTLTKKQWIALILLTAWFVLVLGLTAFSRGSNYSGQFNFSLFSGKRIKENKDKVKNSRRIPKLKFC